MLPTPYSSLDKERPLLTLNPPTQSSLATTQIADATSIPLESLNLCAKICRHFALWLPQIRKQNHRLRPRRPSSPKIRALAEPLLLPVGAPVGAPVEQLEEEVVAVAMAVVGTDLIANGARQVACLVWPVLHAEQRGRRYGATKAHDSMIPIP